tara:strand:- start:592 stop:789 length:198 start_codon:yes stop_codon:yes gene_type:complete
VVQTGANIQSGGLNVGLFSNEYHGSLNVMVAKPPMNEAENVIARNDINVRNLFLNIMNIYIAKNE